MFSIVIISMIMLIAGMLCMKKTACSHCGEQAKTISNKTVGALLIIYSILLILSDYFLHGEMAKGEFIWLVIGLMYFLKKEDDRCLACKVSIR